MLLCGIKTTHDAGIALIEDDKLIFSCELEKLDNNERYAHMTDLGIVFGQLAEYGYDPLDVDEFIIDGWHRRPRPLEWFGQEVELRLAPYRRGLLADDLFHEYRFQVFDLEYSSYAHYAGHVTSAYCTSPFAALREDSYVLAWDAAMFPYLYVIEAESGQARSLGPLFPLIGNTYHTLACKFEPFDKPLDFPRTLGVAGKVMAYIALGQVREEVVDHLFRLADRGYEAELRRWRGETDVFSQFDFGMDILRRMGREAEVDGVCSPDMLASIHAFLERSLVAGLRDKLSSSPYKVSNLCMSGGCALNIKWNSAVRDSGMFDHVWVPPFPNDSGSAIGTACCAMLGKSRHRALTWDVFSGPALRGTAMAPDGWAAEELSLDGVAHILHTTGMPVVFLSGRAELGPRALGHRSILACTSDAGMKDRLNAAKGREHYRPVAPICLEHRAPEIFDPGSPDPYMLFDHDVRPGWISRIPAICHLDNTARLQTVNYRQDPAMFRLLEAYEALSGIPVLCNTSANFRGCGFFPDAESAIRWGEVPYVWADGIIYRRKE
jgi:carbamoyltransferase